MLEIQHQLEIKIGGGKISIKCARREEENDGFKKN